MPTISRILVPVDFSPGSRAALEQALKFADAFGAALEALHVWDVPPTLRPDLMVWLEGSDRQPVESIILQQTNQEMNDFLAELSSEVRARLKMRVERGDPVKTIIEVARTGGFDLLVLGTHGRTGLSHMLIGSVSERVIRHAPCPVLTVRIVKPKGD